VKSTAYPDSHPEMARADLLVARLIVWEGTVHVDKFRSQIKAYSNALKESIDYALRNTKWRYQIWKLRPGVDEGKHKLEVGLFAKYPPTSGVDDS